jgi:hypothetical protein
MIMQFLRHFTGKLRKPLESLSAYKSRVFHKIRVIPHPHIKSPSPHLSFIHSASAMASFTTRKTKVILQKIKFHKTCRNFEKNKRILLDAESPSHVDCAGSSSRS